MSGSIERSVPELPVLFLSGAGLRPWIWDEVRAGLSAETETVVAEYPRTAGASLADYADAVAAQAPWPRFAVVAHSAGGVVAAELLSRHPGRVAALLGVAAVFPAPGRSFAASMAFPARLVLPVMLRMAGTRPPASAIRKGLAAGLEEPAADRVVSEFDPESPRLFLDRVSDRELPVVRAYVRTTGDAEIPAARQAAAAAILAPAWVLDTATGHLPMLEDPVTIGEAIARLQAAAAQ